MTTSCFQCSPSREFFRSLRFPSRGFSPGVKLFFKEVWILQLRQNCANEMWLGSSQNNQIQRCWCWSQSRTFEIKILRMIPLNDLQLEPKFLRKCSAGFYLRRENHFRMISRVEQSNGKSIRMMAAVRPFEGKSICEWFPWFCIRGKIVSKWFVKTRFYHLPFTFMRKPYKGICLRSTCAIIYNFDPEWPYDPERPSGSSGSFRVILIRF